MHNQKLLSNFQTKKIKVLASDFEGQIKPLARLISM